MVIGKGFLVVFVISLVVRCINSQGFRNRIPLNRGEQNQEFPDFFEDNIPTGFVDSQLIYPYNTQGQHPCDRVCFSNSTLNCYYVLILEEYESYNQEACRPECLNFPLFFMCPGCIQTDGVKTRLMSINRQMPGPPINVCQNDLLIVDVINSLPEPSSIHWHGIDQSKSPYMDGMPFITQAEIPSGRIFRYKFVATNHGTNFYHSHSLWQRAQGIYGTLVVRLPPRSNPHWYQYDVDSTAYSIIISDWVYNMERVANNFLVHGKGWSSYNQGTYQGAPNVYFVRPRFRYRFRIIYNGVNNVPMELSIEKHDLILIAADGMEIQPVVVQSLQMNSGERFDFVVAANQLIDNYWIKVSNPLNRTFSQVAILHYEGALLENPSTPPDFSQRPAGLQVNTLNVGPGTQGTVTVSELRGLQPVPWLGSVSWETTYLEFGVNITTLSFHVDQITMVMPQLPMLVEKDRIDESTFCNLNSLAQQGVNCSQITCSCTHVIQYRLNSYIEIIFFSGNLHPAHLHGYLFYVVGMGVTSQPITRQLITEMERRGELQRNTFSPILKDTVQIPRSGYVIVRFYAINPGYWFLHCHIEIHAILGMGAVLQVGQPTQMVPQPRRFQPYPT